jgi:hypothetical protein
MLEAAAHISRSERSFLHIAHTHSLAAEIMHELTLWIRTRTEEERADAYVCIHFETIPQIDRWIAILDSQPTGEQHMATARMLFLLQESMKEDWLHAWRRGEFDPNTGADINEWRLWSSAHVAKRFHEELFACLQWQWDPSITERFNRLNVDLRQSGLWLGVKAIINPATGAQTNVFIPFRVDQPRLSRRDWDNAKHPSLLVCLLCPLSAVCSDHLQEAPDPSAFIRL